MTSKFNHTDSRRFIRGVILPFYDIHRDMRIKKGGRWVDENDAEHSWSVSLLACALAEFIDPKLDKGLIAQYGLVHDLVELYAGDISVWADDELLKYKEKNEVDAIKKFSKEFSKFKWLIDTIVNYEEQNSPEANYVKAIDKYIAIELRIIDKQYFRKAGISKDEFDKKLISHRIKAHAHPGVAKYYELIRDEYNRHPEYFAPST